MVEGLDKSHMRPLQKEAYLCSARCCDSAPSQAALQQCCQVGVGRGVPARMHALHFGRPMQGLRMSPTRALPNPVLATPFPGLRAAGGCCKPDDQQQHSGVSGGLQQTLWQAGSRASPNWGQPLNGESHVGPTPQSHRSHAIGYCPASPCRTDFSGACSAAKTGRRSSCRRSPAKRTLRRRRTCSPTAPPTAHRWEHSAWGLGKGAAWARQAALCPHAIACPCLHHQHQHKPPGKALCRSSWAPGDAHAAAPKYCVPSVAPFTLHWPWPLEPQEYEKQVPKLHKDLVARLKQLEK